MSLHVTKPLALTTLIAGLSLPLAAQTSFGGFEPPEGWTPPPLHPAEVQLETRELAPGVFALVSDRPPVDNSGFVVGDRGVLVIDSHINGVMAERIQAAVREKTDKPILYLVNTNAHGDHTFGNYAFPADTLVVAHAETARDMRAFEAEKANLLATVQGDESVFADVRLRLPDIVFDDALQLDLGGRIVELHHFGHGNTPGDTVVYVPGERIAWTGNLVLGHGLLPWAIEGRVPAYARTVADLATTLDVATIVPGHGPLTTGKTLGIYLVYLNDVIRSVQGALESDWDLERTLEALPLDERYLPPADSPMAAVSSLMQGFHLWNVKQTYQEFAAAP